MTHTGGITLAALTPILIALVHALKLAGLPGKLAPLAAVLIGLAAGTGVAIAAGDTTPQEWMNSLTAGLIWGLTAVGLYSGSAATYGHIKSQSAPNPYDPPPANWPQAGWRANA